MPHIAAKTFLSKRFLPLLCVLIVIWLYAVHNLVNNNPTTKTEQHHKSSLERYEFEYLISNDICRGEGVFMLILVHSAPNHFEHRQLIRTTWGNPGPDLPRVRVAFLLAIAPEELDMGIERENELYRDIIQGDFVDSYRNLTYKHAMGLSWAATNCNGTKYVLKMDDDIFVDVYQLLDYIEARLQHYDLRSSVACYFQDSMPVVRDPVSKWSVSRSEYAADTFQDYCSGWAYLTTPSAAGRLRDALRGLPYFWVDDVHVTGTAAKLANVSRVRLDPLYALEADGLADWTRSREDLKWDRVFAPTWGDLSLSKRAHQKAMRCHRTKCRCCYRPMTTPKATTKAVRGVAQIHPFQIS